MQPHWSGIYLCNTWHNVSVDLLVVVTHQSWIFDDFQKANVLPTVQDFGLDNPLLPKDINVLWWMVTEHAARLRRCRTDLKLQSPGPFWLTKVPT